MCNNYFSNCHQSDSNKYIFSKQQIINYHLHKLVHSTLCHNTFDYNEIIKFNYIYCTKQNCYIFFRIINVQLLLFFIFSLKIKYE